MVVLFFSTLVGWSAYLCWVCNLLLDPHAYSILYECTFPPCSSYSPSPPSQSWDLAYFPISGNEPFDRFGKSYNVSHILRTDDTFDEAAYNAYSPLYLPATYAMTYLLAFALCTCVLVHTALYHGKNLLIGMRKIRIEPDDIHAKLMRNYPEVPEWWYLSAFCGFFALAVVAVEVGIFDFFFGGLGGWLRFFFLSS